MSAGHPNRQGSQSAKTIRQSFVATFLTVQVPQDTGRTFTPGKSDTKEVSISQ